MDRYYGEVGYRETYESEPGIWDERIIPKPYMGDVLKNYVRYTTENTTTIKTPICNNSISIVADPFAFENFHNIVYATYMGTKWTVSNVSVQYPRLILALGGVYNGKEPDISTE